MAHGLAGQLIGSIRKVWFVANAVGTRPGAPLAAGSPAGPDGLIEIETKAGRYAHFAAAPDDRGIGLYPGAAWPTADAPVRQWLDLTESVPTAFDGRPRIAAVVPVGPESDHLVAREWRIQLSTGATLRCCRSGTGLHFGATEP